MPSMHVGPVRLRPVTSCPTGPSQIMLCGRFPFWGKTDIDFLASVSKGPQMRGEAWAGVSDECKDFVRSLLAIDPNLRPTAEQAIDMVWMQSSGGELRTLTSQIAIAESLKKGINLH